MAAIDRNAGRVLTPEARAALRDDLKRGFGASDATVRNLLATVEALDVENAAEREAHLHWKAEAHRVTAERDAAREALATAERERDEAREKLAAMYRMALVVERERDDLRQAYDAAREAGTALAAAIERCDSNRGTFSCAPQHDLRCPKARADSPKTWKGAWVCECGREQLDAALALARREGWLP